MVFVGNLEDNTKIYLIETKVTMLKPCLIVTPSSCMKKEIIGKILVDGDLLTVSVINNRFTLGNNRVFNLYM